MNTSLTTFDGYPRDDLDIAQSETLCLLLSKATADVIVVRTTRARIIWLKNDYKELMIRIEEALHQHHATLQASDAVKESSPGQPAQPSASIETPGLTIDETPFARVNTVDSQSPAHDAGLKAGDKIRSFGSANWMNHENLRKLAEVVQRNEGVSGRMRQCLYDFG